jgi:type I restriction enzyme, S subunit
MKRWPTKPLGEMITIEKGKKAATVFATPTRTSVRYLQIDDLRPSATIKFCEPFNCAMATNSDAVIAWDGANAGTVSCNLSGHIGSTLALLRPTEPDSLIAAFLSRFLESKFTYLQQTATGAAIPHVSKDALSRLEMPLPPLVEQKRIVKLLNEAGALRQLRADADSCTAELIPAFFHAEFGPLKTREPLDELAEVQSGVAKGRNFRGRQPVTVPYVRVANVQDGYLDLTELKMIEALPTEVEELSLRRGDVLLTEGGDFDKLGRGAMLDRDLPGCIHQNHVFRVRCKQSQLLPEYFASFLLSAEARSYFRRCAKKTSNLASINMSQLRALPVPLPSLRVQSRFTQRVREIRELESAQAQSRMHLGALFESLLNRAFKREL